MPRPRERDPNDQIKGRRGGRPQRVVRRMMTAKLRKELAERKRAGQDTPADVQAVDQVEHTGAASMEEVGREAERLIGRAVHPDRKPKERTEAIKEGGQRPGEGPGAKGTHSQTDQRTASGPSGAGTGAAEAAPVPHSRPDTPPSPGERMRQRAAKDLERTIHTGDFPQGNAKPAAFPRYGGRPHGQGGATGNVSPKNQSIHQSNPFPGPPAVKERLQRSTWTREKPPGGAFVPKTRQQVEQAAGGKTLRAAGRPAGKQAAELAGRRARAAAQKSMAQRARKAAKAAADLSKRAVAVTVKAAAAMVSALASLVGGAVLVLALAVVLLIGALLASPFGILFSNEPSRDAVPISAAVAQINIELTDRLEELQSGGGYDRVEVQGQTPDWREVAAVFAANTAGAEDGTDVAALPPEKVELLQGVFWDMCALSSEVKTVEHPASGDNAAWTEKVLVITISHKSAEDMRTAYSFTEFQAQVLTELLAETDALTALLGDLSITQADAVELLQNLPADLAPERRAVVQTACKLVSKLNYFWGGKSLVIGWDSRWGTLREVTAAGNSTTGTYRPYGMDCSGCATRS